MELRDIPGYEDRYAVTADGRVWSHPKRSGGRAQRGLWLVPGYKVGYPVVCLATSDGTRSMHYVHRLVALVWLPNPLGLPEVNHKDSDRSNAHVENLEWCTRAENITHSYRAGNKRPANAMPPEKLALVRSSLAAGEKVRAIAARLVIPVSTVSGIKNGYLYAHNPGEKSNV